MPEPCDPAEGNSLTEALQELSSALESCRDTAGCLALIARAAADLTGSRGAILRSSSQEGMPVLAFFAREIDSLEVIKSANDRETAERAVRDGHAITVNRIAGVTGPDTNQGPAKWNLLSIPFHLGDSCPGVISVFDRTLGGKEEYAPYTGDEREALAVLLIIGSMTMVRVTRDIQQGRMSASLQSRVMELSLLQRISRVALTTRDTGDILRSLLSSITHRKGLGFDRAFLFLLHEEEGALKGLMGIEASTPVRLNQEGAVPEFSPDAIEGEDDDHRIVDDIVADLVVPLDETGGVLARSVLEKRSFSVRLPGDWGLVSAKVLKRMGSVSSFATVPLLSGEKVLGVIWADNIRSSRPIREELDLLAHAGAQAGLTVERSMRVEAMERMKNQVADLQDQLAQWERMAVLGEMAATLAHEVKNPLVSIGGFARRLKKSVPEGGEGVEYADIIIREVDRLERTMEDVLAFTRGYSEVHREPTSIEDLLGDCVELFREGFRRKGVSLVERIQTGLPSLNIDPTQVKQAIFNVLVNAGQASPEDGEITLEAAALGAEDRGMVRISIADQGNGISPGDEEKVFQPFFSTRPTGIGLGLAIAHRAFSSHGGEIKVDNRPGEGVTFVLTLPVIETG